MTRKESEQLLRKMRDEDYILMIEYKYEDGGTQIRYYNHPWGSNYISVENEILLSWNIPNTSERFYEEVKNSKLIRLL